MARWIIKWTGFDLTEKPYLVAERIDSLEDHSWSKRQSKAKRWASKQEAFDFIHEFDYDGMCGVFKVGESKYENDIEE